MREVGHLPRRTPSRDVLAPRLARVAIQVGRYGQFRARAPSEHGWAVRVATALQATLGEVSRST